MRKATWLMLALALAVLVAAPALLAEEAKAPAEGKAKAAANEKGESKEKSASGLRGEYDIMAGKLKLTAEQQAAMAAKMAAIREASTARRKDTIAKLEAARETLNKARESGDKEAAKKATEDIIRIVNEDREKFAADDAAIRAIYTPEQLQVLEGVNLFRLILARYKKADLTDEQYKKVRELCEVAGKEIAAGKTNNEVRAKLEKDVEGLLTAAQKEALKPAEKAAAAPAPAAPAAVEKKPDASK